MADCLFCKIVSNEVASYKILEDANYLSFLDNRPLTEGHTLVIPKKHYNTVWEIPPTGQVNMGDYSKFIQLNVKLLQKAYYSTSVNSLILGYEVSHACVHLIPNANKGFALSLGNYLFSQRKTVLSNGYAFDIWKKITRNK